MRRSILIERRANKGPNRVRPLSSVIGVGAPGSPPTRPPPGISAPSIPSSPKPDSATGGLIGHDLLGGSFVYDPFELYARGVLSNPNMVVFGQIGRGKSAFVKTYLWRQAVFGRRAWVVDPKGEYGALARHWGVRPVALRPDGPVRLNPLDADRVGTRAARWTGSPTARAASSLAGADDLLPRERTALSSP